jgi:hypothetical protein
MLQRNTNITPLHIRANGYPLGRGTREPTPWRRFHRAARTASTKEVERLQSDHSVGAKQGIGTACVNIDTLPAVPYYVIVVIK